jgi:hypothetical protein
MKALITLVLLGTASVALAQPAPIRDQRDPVSPPIVTPAPNQNQYDPRYDDRHDLDDQYDHDDDRYDHDWRHDRDGRFDHRMRWWRRPVLLASNVQMIRQYERDYRPMVIDIDARRTAGVTKLRLDRDYGRMYIDSVVVTFTDGHQQTVELNRMLSARDPSIVIDLDHRGATALYIYGTTLRARGATFDVIGLRR